MRETKSDLHGRKPLLSSVVTAAAIIPGCMMALKLPQRRDKRILCRLSHSARLRGKLRQPREESLHELGRVGPEGEHDRLRRGRRLWRIHRRRGTGGRSARMSPRRSNQKRQWKRGTTLISGVRAVRGTGGIVGHMTLTRTRA
jgi:hypothetical protein